MTSPANTESPRTNGSPLPARTRGLWALAAVSAGFLALCTWVYWPSLVSMARTWGADPQYSHGYLVPMFSVVLLWLRRSILLGPAAESGAEVPPGSGGPAALPELRGSWWGMALLGVSGLMRLAGGYLNIDWVADISLLPCLAGLFVLVGGWRALAWSWPALAFLAFMVPLPYQTTYALSGPLRGLATTMSTYALQTVGLPALAEGQTISIPSGPIDVAEACSGLSMLFVFLAISFGMALMVNRPLLDKGVILLSAIPIAIVANTARIVVTGLALEYLGREAADVIFHDLAGWLMMPFALGVLWLEMKVIDWILVVPERAETVVPGVSKAAVIRNNNPPRVPGVPMAPAVKGK